MDSGETAATAGGSGDSSWYDSGSLLSKAAFTFVATSRPSTMTDTSRTDPVESGAAGHSTGLTPKLDALAWEPHPSTPATITDQPTRPDFTIQQR